MQKIRNVAIIAHVDHGKTTLVDKMLEAGNLFRANQEMGTQILDSNDLERERGITILSKNVSIHYNGYKINIIDTPGHSDFGGEVERVLNMADGCLLLVDAFEGPMPQTRFVLQKAIEIGLKPIVVINKVDKPNCRPDEVQESVFELMCNLDATEDQLDFPTVFGSAKQGWMSLDWNKPTDNINAVLDAIIEHIPGPEVVEGEPQMLITSLDYNSYVGRIAVGRVHRGELTDGMEVSLCQRDGKVVRQKIKELRTFEGMSQVHADSVKSGDICAIIGLEGFEIGDTVSDPLNPDPLPRIAIDEPTMSMLFTINDSPFFGKDGKFVTSRHINERLQHELQKNLALRVEKTEREDAWNVFGRGVLHLSVLIEEMRREGYELCVSKPEVLFEEIDGRKCEPYETVIVNTPSDYASTIISDLQERKATLLVMSNGEEGYTHLEFSAPTRGLIGYRSAFITNTKGEGIMVRSFDEYKPYAGEIRGRKNGVLVSMETGKALGYSLYNLQDRGQMIVGPGADIYVGMIVGIHNRDNDLNVNPCKNKEMSNTRSKSADDAIALVTPKTFSLEEALEFIEEDEYVEVTPAIIRLRKKILDPNERFRVNRK